MLLVCVQGIAPIGGTSTPETAPLATDARRLIATKCLRCHGGVRERAGLNLLGLARATQPAASGNRAVVPGDPDASELIRRVECTDPDDRMPSDAEPLSRAEQQLLRAWIDAGAPDAQHWSWVVPRRSVPPPEAYSTWCAQPIDQFILAGLHAAGLEPTPPADRATLLRRASLDLTGLPPTSQELNDFLKDGAPDAFIRVVDRLLASPTFGEHWAAKWLDIARYADTQGYEKDLDRPIWAYRDWVIDAINADMPYDRFTRQQLAGDLLPGATDTDRVATAFHRNTLNNTEGGTDDEEFRMAAVMDRVATTWNAWMGLSMQCVQCHGHPYDTLAHEDYYRFLDFFNQQADRDTNDDAPVLALALTTGTTTVPVMQELPATERRTTHRLDRGSLSALLEAVSAGTPGSLHPFRESWPRDRRGAAEWLMADDNPLTARVMVNRVWESVFGVGLVNTSEDFGVMGEPPSNPALLDDLAVRFREGGWRLKSLLRELVLSSAYAQGSAAVGAGAELDPDNRLLWHSPRPRLDAEVVRDSALLVAGLLSAKRGGPPVMPPQPDGIWNIVYNGSKWETSSGEDRYRRGIYTYLRRSAPYPSFITMDSPDRITCSVRRLRTNTPLAALVTLNDPAFVECAVAMAIGATAETALARGATESANDDSARDVSAELSWCWRRALCRPPLDSALAALLTLYAVDSARFAARPEDAVALVRVLARADAQAMPAAQCLGLAPLASVANAILNTDEFLTRP